MAASAAAAVARVCETSHALDEAIPGPVRALDFGAYGDLAFGLSGLPNEAKVQAANYLARRLPAFAETAIDATAAGGAGKLPAITSLSSDDYSPAEIDRLIRWWDSDADNHLALTAPSATEFSQAKSHIAKAFDHLRLCAPDLFAEITAIVRDIVIARSGDAARMQFGGGATSLALWGSLLADPVSNSHWLTMYRTIVHESAHNLLFALARNEPLVGNAPEERFASPVRADLRPMDGVYHAAYVATRESLGLDALLAWHDETGGLGSEDSAIAFGMLEASVTAFWECQAILRREASLTTLGEDILTQCEAFMEANFALESA